ncbi:MAG TPA: dihydroorotase [Clostridiales bacterium]|nr:dihydroorotase [Clostridiales bacterium]
MSTLLIKHTRLIDPSQGIDRIMNLLVENGKIKELDTAVTTADTVINGQGLITAPGLVDMHVHLRDPGFTDKEDILTGCNAAVAGGVTSLLAMPNTNPTTDNPETVKYILDKAKNAKARVYVAASITKGLKSEELCSLEELKNAGAIGLTDDGRPVVNTSFMAQAMIKAPMLGMTVVAHCEDLYLADGGKVNEGEVSRKLGVKGIPAAAEDTGTAREIALAAAYNVPIHICHVSTKTSVALIRDAKRRGVQVTAETAPHYFLMTDKELLKRDADYRMNPPLRTQEDCLAIIEGLCDGTLDAIATDHAPHTPQEKADFVQSPNGSIGMETSLSCSITGLVNTGKMTINQIIDKMSTTPAKLLGIGGGTIQVGVDADLVMLDPKEKWTVDADRLHGKSKNTPFKGMTLTGKVKKTILNGRVVFEDK